MDFGAFVSVLPGKDGLVHISQISNERVENVTDKVNEGDIVKVKVIDCLLYTSPSPRDSNLSRMPSSA